MKRKKNIEAIYPLSPTQSGILFHTLYHPESEAYFQQLVYRIQGKLDLSAFQTAWQRVVERHAVLRTLFVWENQKKPLQIVVKSLKVPVNYFDWRVTPEAELNERLNGFLAQDRRHPFACNRPPLLRCTLIQVGENNYRFVFSFHHLILDGWSLALVLQDVFSLYGGKGSERLDPPSAFRDYINWLQKRDQTETERFWREALADVSSPTPFHLPLPENLSVSNGESYGEHELRLSPEITSELRALGRTHHLTLGTFVMGAWALLAGNYSGEKDVLFGTTVSGRPPGLAGVDAMVGMFINTLPAPVRVNRSTPLLPWLSQFQKQQSQREAHGHCALVDIQDWSRIPKGIPLFKSIVVIENYPVSSSLSNFPGDLRIDEAFSFEQTNYPLTLLAAVEERLLLKLSFHANRFENRSIQRLLEQLRVLIENMVADPHRSAASIPLFTEPQRRDILSLWNHNSTPVSPVPIQRYFEIQATTAPEATALVDLHSHSRCLHLSYAFLNESAQSLARSLKKRGAGRGSLVGLCCGRSNKMVTGILGILKAGAAYLPLDPSHPKDRLRHLIGESELRLIVVEEDLAGRLPKCGVDELILDHESLPVSGEAQDRGQVQTSFGKQHSEDAAYVIYTSGSTGSPKGVVVSHGAIGNRLVWAKHTYPMNAQDTFLHLAAFGFDISLWEMMAPLMSGGRLITVPEEVSKNPSTLLDVIARHRVSFVHFVPSLFDVFLQESQFERARSLKAVFCGGEALPHKVYRRGLRCLEAEVHHFYGPTEAAINVTAWDCRHGSDVGRVSLGHPISNTQVYLVDGWGHPVAPGVRGEIVIAGACLARGYLNNPQLTAVSFVPNPFSKESGARCYKTGDWASYQTGGRLIFHGRRDQQIKLRGMRIELGEIERVLAAHPSVEEVVVQVRADGDGPKHLIGWIRPSALKPGDSTGDQSFDMDALTDFAKTSLPAYMVPSNLIVVQKFPLNANGKVDREALAKRPLKRQLSTGKVPPRTSNEGLLQSIWSEVLGIEAIGIHDNFFELGGDSIVSIQVVARARKLGLNLTLNQIFQYQTIAELGRVAKSGVAQVGSREPEVGSAPLTPVQRRFFESNGSAQFCQSIQLEASAHVSPIRMKAVVRVLISHHDGLRYRFPISPDGTRAQQAGGPAGSEEWFFYRDFSQLECTEKLAALKETGEAIQAGFDLQKGPLVGLALVRLEDEGHPWPFRLLIVIHHLVVDGVSWRILLEDLRTLYDGDGEVDPLDLPPKTETFLQWSRRLSEFAQTDEIEQEGVFWNSASQGASPLPLDFDPETRIEERDGNAELVSSTLEESYTRALLVDVPPVYNTQINDLLLTALALTLNTWTQSGVTRSGSFVLELEGHGREWIGDGLDITRTTGWFTSLFPVRLELPQNRDPASCLKAVKEQLRAVPRRGIGFGLLRYLHRDPSVRESLAAIPRPQVGFNYLGQTDQVLGGVSWLRMVPESMTADVPSRAEPEHVLDVNAVVVDQQLKITWLYRSEMLRRETVADLAHGFMEQLHGLIDHCLAPDSGGRTPSDFPLTRLDQETLDGLLAHGDCPTDDLYPLSPMQLGILFHALNLNNSDPYFEQMTCVFRGAFRVEAFKSAWDEVVARHGVLRTSFLGSCDPPLQRVAKSVPLLWREFDWRECSPSQQESRLAAFLKEDRGRGFDLGKGPLIRFALMRLSSDSWQFVWSHHHLLLDGWSIANLFRELFSCYGHFSGKEKPPLPAVRPFRDYIAWLKSQSLSAAERYWKTAFADFSDPEPIKLANTGNAKTGGWEAFEDRVLTLPIETRTGLDQMVRHHGLTLNTLVQGAWALLLATYSDTRSPVFGVTTSGRSPELEGVEAMVGLFINTLPTRVAVASQQALLRWLQQLQKHHVEQESFSFTPLQQIQAWCGLSKGVALFDSILIFENYPVDSSLGKGDDRLKIEDTKTIERTNYPITLGVMTRVEIQLVLTYDTSQFESQGMERLLQHLHNILKAMTSKPQGALSQISLLDYQERETMLYTWNDTANDNPIHQLFHQQFETVAARYPDALAVEPASPNSGGSLTYGALNARSNQLARQLRASGVASEMLVGLCLEREPSWIPCMLAVLKVGGAFLPLDPDYPLERLAFLIQDSGISTLIASENTMDRLPATEITFLNTLILEEADSAIDEHATGDLCQPSPGNTLAYVIYTSGSTGQPKGVQVTHHGLSNLVQEQVRKFQVNTHDRVLQFASPSFDASVSEMGMALASGAKLQLVDRGTALSAGSFCRFLRERAVTHVTLPPSFLATLPRSEFPSFTALIVAGEAMPEDLSRKWSVERDLFNAYGPTEFTVCATIARLGGEKPVIGTPIGNTCAFILDERMFPSPIGLPGSLFLGGTALARGYHYRPHLTAENFVPNPFADGSMSQGSGSRLYRTGDRCRFLPDGTIDFLGRVDQQVKIRGYRIEPAEVEAELNRNIHVLRCAVISGQDPSGLRKLVAFVVLAQGSDPTPQTFREDLQERLPAHMVPASFFIVDELPLTYNGKIDRRALERKVGESREMEAKSERGRVAPRNETEKKLAEIWGEVLNVPQPGVEDNFFDLGGDSIIGIQIVARAKQAGIFLNGEDLFEHQTIGDLVKVAGTESKIVAEQGLVSGPLPLTPIQHWFFEKFDSHHYNQAVLLETPGDLEPDLLRGAGDGLVKHHDVLRLRFTHTENGILQRISETPDPVLLNVEDFSHLDPSDAKGSMASAIEALQGSLNFMSGPLMRVAWYRLNNREGRLLIVLHHLLVDAVSWPIIVEDFQKAYEQLASGVAIALPLKTTSYKTWALRLSEFYRSEAAKGERRFWEDLADRVADEGGIRPLRLGVPDAIGSEPGDLLVKASLNEERTVALLTEIHRAYRTRVQEILLAALYRAVRSVTGARTLVVHWEGHGRDKWLEDVDLSRTVGWFTNLVPIRISAASPVIDNLVKEVKELMRSIPNRGLGFGPLRYLSPDSAVTLKMKTLADGPIGFNYLGQLAKGSETNTLFKLAEEGVGALQARELRPAHGIEVNAMIHNGTFQIGWSFDPQMHGREGVAALADTFLTCLEEIIDHCLLPESGGFTPSDFPSVELDQETLDHLLGTDPSIEDLYPLSPLQGGLLFHTIYDNASGAYFEQMSCRLTGDLDVSCFKRAWNTIVAEHPVFRTSFHWKGLQAPLQWVHPSLDLPWEDLDWRTMSPSEQRSRHEAFLVQDRERGFQLDEAPLTRWYLIQMNEQVYQLVWSHHHILIDGWSMARVLRQLFEVYRCFRQGIEPTVEPVPAYRNYIEWLQKQDLDRAEKYWTRLLKGYREPLALSRKPPARPGEKVVCTTYEYLLSHELTKALHELTRVHRLTLNTLLQGAWSLLLCRYTHKDDVVFGMTLSGRPPELSGVTSMVGLFINTLPMRVSVPDSETLVPWLENLQAQQLENEKYGFTPLVKIQAWSDVQRGSEFFESLVVLENYPLRTAMDGSESQLAIDNVHHFEVNTFPMTLSVMPGEALNLTFVYDQARFSSATVQRMAHHVEVLLQSCIRTPESRLADLPMLREAERVQLLETFNQTDRDLPPGKGIAALFEDQVWQRPEAVALQNADLPAPPSAIPDRGKPDWNADRMSYRSLNARANQLAHFLIKRGVVTDQLVGLCLDRSVASILASLAVLKAGGAYLPLDPEFPLERLSYILGEAAPNVVISTADLIEALPSFELNFIDTVLLDEDWSEISQESETNPGLDILPENLAYAMYTSGSTGNPKGSAIPHQGVIRLLFENDYATIDEDCVALLSAPITFDAATYEIWAPLLKGGRCHVLLERLPTAHCLRNAIELGKVNTIYLTAALFNNVVNEDPMALSGLRDLLLGGEALSATHVGRFQKQAPGVRIINGYGPTENTTFTCCYTVPEDFDPGRESVLIGTPIACTRAYLLDSRFELVPMGVAGELFTAGLGLARAYLNQPVETALKFVPDPFSPVPGGRLYRTGDLAYYLEDGTMDYLGRTDFQVKVRGFRIELSEIERVLLSHESVRDCVVVAREYGPNDKRLVAYLQPREELIHCSSGDGADAAEDETEGGSPERVRFAGGPQDPLISEVRTLLKEKLPDYMIPSALVLLEELPLTDNSKVDRNALPDPESYLENAGGSYIAPRNPVEETVAGIWKEVLRGESGPGNRKIGIHDNFFDLGGHSLLATQVISRMREALDVELPFRVLFEQPTVAEVSQCLAGLLKETNRPIEPVSSDLLPPLSFAQQRLWFLNQLDVSDTSYNIFAALKLKGSLDTTALGRALDEVVARHESLRTTVANRDGRAVQVLSPGKQGALFMVDVAGMPSDRAEGFAFKLAETEFHRPFQLESGPLLRVSLVRLSLGRHLLLVAMHHIVSDGWSMGIFTREIAQLYRDQIQLKASFLSDLLPALPIQYSDFAHWQRQGPGAELIESQMDYWEEQLADLPPFLDLPCDCPHQSRECPKAASIVFDVGMELTRELETLSRRGEATLFMTLLAAFKLMLARYSGMNDIVVGSPIANRNRAETEGLIGFFVNTLVLRTDLSGDLSFSELLERVKKTTLDAYQNQDVPFERLVEALQPRRSLNQTPLFQVMFVLQNTPEETLQLPGVEMDTLDLDPGMAKFDVTITWIQEASGLQGSLEFNANLYHRSIVEGWVSHYLNLLSQLPQKSNSSMETLNLSTAGEKKRLLANWNQSAPSVPDLPVHRLFENQAAQLPDAVAVDRANRYLTYGVLDRASNCLAWDIRSRGLGWDHLIGLALERSPEMVVAMVGVLKAGCAYLPMDLDDPAERTVFLLKDAGVSLIIGTGISLKRLTVRDSATVDTLVLGSNSEASFHRESAIYQWAQAESLAYLMFTSGSSGTPKAVGIPHGAIVRLVKGQTYARLDADRVVLAAAPPFFDAATFELWGSLLNGARCSLFENEVPSARLLERHLKTKGVTTLWLTAALFNHIVDEDPKALSGLKQLLIGGEALSVPHVAAYRECHPDTSLVNGYGPTENTTFTCCFSIPPSVDPMRRSIPIGKAIGNTRICVLDHHLEPVPAGVLGHLYCSGAGLARGYLNRPGLTAVSFLPHPYPAFPGERCYRSGDLVRLRTDGNLEFLGRADQQVKLRGFRIELGEVEVVLRTHPAVKNSAARIFGTGSTGQQLVAYVQVAASGTGSASALEEELRRFLAAKLPKHMVPTRVLQLDEFPLTPNGKVNRAALPEIQPVEKNAVDDLPIGPLQGILASIWKDLLNLDQVGIHDDFFNLGGHSLLATKAQNRILRACHVEIPLRRLFDTPTIAGLAATIEAMHRGPSLGGIPVVAKEDGLYPLSFSQRRLWLIDQAQPGFHGYNIPMALTLQQSLDLGALERALNEIVRRHNALRTYFPTLEDEPMQRIAPFGYAPLATSDLSGLNPEERSITARQLALTMAHGSFDLARGPLAVFHLLRLGAGDHRLLANCHHIVADAWSMGVLRHELGVLYESFAMGQSSPLPELPIQFADFSCWQREQYEKGAMEPQLAYWKGRLQTEEQPLVLPFKRAVTEPVGSRAGVHQFKMGADLNADIEAFAQQHHCTPFMVLLGIFKVLLFKLTQRDSVSVGVPVSGRNSLETEKLIGFFVNTLVFRTQLTGNPRFGEFLEQVRDITLGAYANQDLPFDRLVAVLRPERDSGHSPLFQVMFNYLEDAPDGRTLGGEGGDVSDQPDDPGQIAKFDLTVTVIHRPGSHWVSMEYNADLYEESAIQLFGRQFETLAKSVLTQSDRRIHKLEHRTPSELDSLAKREKRRKQSRIGDLKALKPKPITNQ